MFGRIQSGNGTQQTQDRPRLRRYRRSHSFPGANAPTRAPNGRSVEQRYGLINALDNLWERITESFKPIGEFLCKHLSWKNLRKVGREAKHQANQASYDAQIHATDSKFKRAKLKAKREIADFRHDVREQAKDAGSWLKRLFV